MTKSDRYPIEVFWSEEDQGYIAIAPDLPGCSAWGKSQGDAVREMADAIDAWIEAASKSGKPVPEPATPIGLAEFSGKFVVRVPRQLHASLVRNAHREGVSLNHYVVYLLADANARGTQARTTPSVAMAAESMHRLWLVQASKKSATIDAVAVHFFLSSEGCARIDGVTAQTMDKSRTYFWSNSPGKLGHKEIQLEA